MTIAGDSTPNEPEAERVGPVDQAESELIAQEYEEEAAMDGGPTDVEDLVIRIRKIEERLASIEDYLGGPPSKETLETRLEQLEQRVVEK
jgi:hypothetical protein